MTEAFGLGKGKENTEGGRVEYEKGQKDVMTRVTKAALVRELTFIHALG